MFLTSLFYVLTVKDGHLLVVVGCCCERCLWNVDCLCINLTNLNFNNHSNGYLSCGLCNLFGTV